MDLKTPFHTVFFQFPSLEITRILILLLFTGLSSKKTCTVLIARILYLILRQGVKPESILALTFSKAAAREMDVRFEQLYGQEKGIFKSDGVAIS